MTRSRKSTQQSPALVFADAILSASAKARNEELRDALGELVKRRLRKPKKVLIGYLNVATGEVRPVSQPKAQRRSPRRVAFKRYTATQMTDTSRYGTFRRYMITTIRAHNDTLSANAEHAKCDNPKFAKNKLDFNWAADNGYITFE